MRRASIVSSPVVVPPQYVGTCTGGALSAPASALHECRSLSERLYREQGIDTKTLLGHKHQSMTDAYNDDRGLSAGRWQHLEID